MNVILLILIVIGLIGAIIYLLTNLERSNNQLNTTEKTKKIPESKTIQSINGNDDPMYTEKLHQTKKGYPFESWREAFFEYEMEQYTAENCNAAKTIFDTLIAKLIALGKHGKEKDKIALFEKAVNSLNTLDSKILGFIETGEREDLCELIDQITIAAGLNPQNYADGEGLADLWREW